MTAYDKTLSCMQVPDIGEAKRHYEHDLGCTVRREHGDCATLDCRDAALLICRASAGESLSRSPHDELDEMADAFWCEEPGYC